MDTESCGNSDIEIDSAVAHLSTRIASALDAMGVAELKQLVQEIESEITHE